MAKKLNDTEASNGGTRRMQNMYLNFQGKHECRSNTLNISVWQKKKQCTCIHKVRVRARLQLVANGLIKDHKLLAKSNWTKSNGVHCCKSYMQFHHPG